MNFKYNYSVIDDALKSIRSITVMKLYVDLIMRIRQNLVGVDNKSLLFRHENIRED